MLVFVIPLKSPEVSKSWKCVSKLLERTLKSVCNQTSSEFRVIVVCHQKPEIEFTHPHLTYIEVDFPLPKHKNPIARGDTDKGRKILRGLVHARKFNPSHIMTVDADDCVSKHLAEFVNRNSDANGWFINKGYKYQDDSQYIYVKRKNFYRMCGTGNILKYQLLDFPINPEYNRGYGYYKFYLVHAKIREIMGQKSTPLKPLLFPGAVYILNKEGNLSSNESKLNFNWFNKRKLTDEIRREFFLYNINDVSEKKINFKLNITK